MKADADEIAVKIGFGNCFIVIAHNNSGLSRMFTPGTKAGFRQ
jgi:hypothetical protein